MAMLTQSHASVIPSEVPDRVSKFMSLAPVYFPALMETVFHADAMLYKVNPKIY